MGITSLLNDDVDKSLDELNTAMSLVPSEDAGGLFRACLKLATTNQSFKKSLPDVAVQWRDKLSQSPERDTLLPELDRLIDKSG